MIDKIGGVGPNYNPRKSEPVAPVEKPVSAAYKISISAEGSQKADIDRIARMAISVKDPEREEKIRLIREKLARDEYRQLSEPQLDDIAQSLMRSFFG